MCKREETRSFAHLTEVSDRIFLHMMDGAVHGSVPVAAASERVIGFSAFVVIRLIGHLTAAISAIHKTGQ